MKNQILLALLTIISSIAFAQEQDSTQTKEAVLPIDTTANLETNEEPPKIIYYKSSGEKNTKKRKNDIKTLSGSMNHSGGFGAVSFRTTEFRDESMVMAGLRGGWIINRTLAIGLEGHGIIPTAKYTDVSPGRELNILGGYGGLFLELIFFSNEVVHVTFPVSGGAGWLGYQVLNENNTLPPIDDDLVDSDVFWYVEPGANLEFNISRNFRLALGVSKRFVQDFELINTPDDAFENLNYYLTLKIGGF